MTTTTELRNIEFVTVHVEFMGWRVKKQEIPPYTGGSGLSVPSNMCSEKAYYRPGSIEDANAVGRKKAEELGLKFFEQGDEVISIANKKGGLFGTFGVLTYNIKDKSIQVEGSMSYDEAIKAATQEAAAKTHRALVLPELAS